MAIQVADATESLVEAVRAAFKGHANPDAQSMRESIDAVARYLATDDKVGGQLLIDKRAVLCGILAVGATQSSTGTPRLSTARWTYEWLEKRGSTLDLRSVPPASLERAHMQGAAVRLTPAMHDDVLPEAHRLAKETMGRNAFDVRHLFFALLKEPGVEWSEVVAPPMSATDFDALRHHLVALLVGSPEQGERTEVWEKLTKARRPTPKKGRTRRTSPKASPSREALPTLADHPAIVDELGRKWFAKALAERLRRVRAEAAGAEDVGAFMAHIHGRWGYGKSSVLNFLRRELEEQPSDEAWLVVEFNAWKHQRMRPPWWSLIAAVYDRARKAPGVYGNWRRRLIWWSWRIRTDWLPILLVIVVLSLLALGVGKVLGTEGAAITVISGLIALGAAIFASGRILAFGSKKAADAYFELKTDPYQPVAKLYCRLIRAIDRPVAIFIDDLDRCDSDCVVELIEGIQTLLRSEPVVYVVAADRKWICAAFEKKYSDFSVPIGEPARPLGYLFLDKLFQISAGLPGLSQDARDGYWRRLLDSGERGPVAVPLSSEQAEAQVKDKHSIEALQKVIDDAPVGHRPALRAAAAVEITRVEAAAALEHRLQTFAPLLEANPRAMKRLVNAVGMAQSRCFLEARDIPLDALARWTLIELRWPLLADYLADHIETVDDAGKDDRVLAEAELPPNLAAMMTDPALRAIIEPDEGPGLDAKQLRALLS
jgi:KAP family P-loop domain